MSLCERRKIDEEEDPKSNNKNQEELEDDDDDDGDINNVLTESIGRTKKNKTRIPKFAILKKVDDEEDNIHIKGSIEDFGTNKDENIKSVIQKEDINKENEDIVKKLKEIDKKESDEEENQEKKDNNNEDEEKDEKFDNDKQ